MKKIFFIAYVFITSVVSGQLNIRELSISDTLPDVILSNVYNYPQPTIRLSDFKGKLIILDFWATWCGTCIESFPKLQELQGKFDSSVQFLLVNVESAADEAKVNIFFQKRKLRTGDSMLLPYSLGDTILRKLFPFFSIPHVVWIDTVGKVIAITGKEDVTSENISKAILGEKFEFTMKDDSLRYSSKSILRSDSFVFRSFLTPENRALGAVGGTNSDNNGKVIKLFATNHPLYSLLQMAWPKIFKFPSNRTFVTKADLDLNKRYCYEIITPPVNQNIIMKYLQEDLRRSFHIAVGTEKRKMECYVLTSNDKIKYSLSKGRSPASDIEKTSLKKYLYNQKVDMLSSLLSVLLQTPVLNETKVQIKIDIDFPGNVYDMDYNELKLFLYKIGFNLIKTQRTLEVAVIRPGLD